ncbi:hypothetical protein PT85_01415 [Pseudomonas flexibilis]|uniref:Uncharacterized protein n=2 Tax=Pseudomonas flexibilis TaxID=706570 RepID=A0A0B3BZY8_9PSED|nr:hypothetical protein PT85_01415 [Pseudomonas flexibilis]
MADSLADEYPPLEGCAAVGFARGEFQRVEPVGYQEDQAAARREEVMREMRWGAVMLLGLLLAACGDGNGERDRPPAAPAMQPGNPAAEGADRPDLHGEEAGTER